MRDGPAPAGPGAEPGEEGGVLHLCYLPRAVAHGGRRGVVRMVDILRAELEVAMALTGCVGVDRAGPELLLAS